MNQQKHCQLKKYTNYTFKIFHIVAGGQNKMTECIKFYFLVINSSSVDVFEEDAKPMVFMSIIIYKRLFYLLEI